MQDLERLANEVALDCLWKDAKLWDVLLTLPEDLIEIRRNGEDSVLHFTRGLKPSDWDKFHYYAKRIIEVLIEYDPDICDSVHGSVYHALSSYRPIQQLYPHAKAVSIDFHPGNTALAPCLPTLLQPGLRKFAFSAWDLHPLVSLTIAQIPRICPYLEEYIFDCTGVLESRIAIDSEETRDIWKQYLDLLSQTILEFNDLTDVGLRPLELDKVPEVLLHLSKFPSLRILHIDVREPLPTSTFHIPVRFSHLQVLRVEVRTWPVASALVDTIKHCPLELLAIGITSSAQDPPDVPLLLEFFRKLSTLKTLNDIIIEETSHGLFPSGSTPPVIEAGLIELSGIQQFTYACSSAVIFTDEWISSLGAAWTRLSTLALYSEVGRPTLSLRDLVPLIINCRFLEHLKVSVFCFPFDLDILSGTNYSQVRSVEFRNSMIFEVTEAIQCLLVMFPQARTIYGHPHEPTLIQLKRWEELNNRIRPILRS